MECTGSRTHTDGFGQDRLVTGMETKGLYGLRESRFLGRDKGDGSCGKGLSAHRRRK